MGRSTTRRFAPFAGVAVLVLPALAAIAAAVATATPAHAATTVTAQQGFEKFQGDENHRSATFIVPPAVTQVRFVAEGGRGGNGGANAFTVGGDGGHAARVAGNLSVFPGQQFDLYLGPAGGDASDNAFQAGSPGVGGGLTREDDHGGIGGAGDGNSGGGGGGGAATTVSSEGTLFAVAGGGGGGGGAGGVAGYVGGPAGSAGPGTTGGTGGTGLGAGSGGGTLSCASTNNSHTGGQGNAANDASTGGGGGGGGAGYGVVTCGGAGGSGGGTGGGGGGGAGGGASYWDTAHVTQPDLETANDFTDGYVVFSWNLPQSSVSVSATSYAGSLELVAHVAPQDVSTPTPTGTVDFSETPDGVSESPLGSATIDSRGNATLVTSGAYSGFENFIARYRGDDTYSASQSFVAYNYSPAPVAPAFSAGPDSNPAAWNAQGTLSATVLKPDDAPAWAPAPTGTVTFTDTTGGDSHQFSSTKTLDANGGASTTIQWSTTGTYTIRADYSGDANYATQTTTFNVVVNAQAPVANAGSDQSANSGATVTIDGSASTDPQGSPLSYDWEQLDGPAATITDKRAARTTVKLPTTTAKTVVHLRLTVTNGAGLSNTADIAITVNPK